MILCYHPLFITVSLYPNFPTQVASFNDTGKLDFSGFKNGALEPQAFRQQLDRVFSLKLTDAELGALITLFDSNGDGKINHVEFVHNCLKIGRNRRDCKAVKNNSMRKRQNDDMQRKKDTLLNTIVPPNLIVLPTSWTKEEEASASKKILAAALSYNGKRFQIEVGIVTVSAFP